MELQHCAGELSLEVTDDGRGLAGLAAGSGTGPETGPGSGLRGMSERLTALGGRLSLGDARTSAGGRGLRLVATVPATPAPAPAAEAGDAGAARGRPAAARQEPRVRGRTTASASGPARPD